MAFNTDLSENVQIVSAFPVQDLNNDATGDWVSLKNYDGCLVVFHKNAGTAGDDPSLLTEQATDVSGTGAKALNFTRLKAKVGATALSAVGQFTTYTFTATNDLDLVSVGGTDLAADTGEALCVLNFRASDLDVSGGFDCLRVSIEGDDIGNSVYGAAYYILYNARYPDATLASAIAD